MLLTIASLVLLESHISWLARGWKRVRSVMLTSCKSLLSVLTGVFCSGEQLSKKLCFCTQARDEAGSPFPYHDVLYSLKSVKVGSRLGKGEFIRPPATAKTRPNLPMDSYTSASMIRSVEPTHTCFDSDCPSAYSC